MDPDWKGANELEAAGFLLASRQPADHEDAHEGHQHHASGTELERDLPTECVESLRGSVEGDRGGVVLSG